MRATPQRPGRCAALIAVAVLLAALLPEVSHAASRICRQLEAELAATEGGLRPVAQSRRQEAAIARQREQLQLAKRQARKSGCSFRLFGGGSNSCAAMNQNIDRMERNLAALERGRSRSANAGSSRSRSQILAALRANGCRDEAVAKRRQPLDGARNLFDHIFGGGIRQRSALDELGEPVLRDDDSRSVRRVPREPQGGWVNDNGRIRYSAPPGRYRTLCVRTCDGYYFPMSTSSSPSDFERDQSNCQTSCPGTEVQIYYHRPEQESDSMVSGLSGQPYADLPTAWLYKQIDVSSPAGCACNAPRNEKAKNYSIIAGNPPAAPRVETEPVTLQPTGRLDSAGAPKVNSPKSPAAERKVRVVGPVFLPDPKAAADPQAQAPKEVR